MSMIFCMNGLGKSHFISEYKGDRIVSDTDTVIKDIITWEVWDNLMQTPVSTTSQFYKQHEMIAQIIEICSQFCWTGGIMLTNLPFMPFYSLAVGMIDGYDARLSTNDKFQNVTKEEIERWIKTFLAVAVRAERMFILDSNSFLNDVPELHELTY